MFVIFLTKKQAVNTDVSESVINIFAVFIYSLTGPCHITKSLRCKNKMKTYVLCPDRVEHMNVHVNMPKYVNRFSTSVLPQVFLGLALSKICIARTASLINILSTPLKKMSVLVSEVTLASRGAPTRRMPNSADPDEQETE